jgi:hypothetical protein
MTGVMGVVIVCNEGTGIEVRLCSFYFRQSVATESSI